MGGLLVVGAGDDHRHLADRTEQERRQRAGRRGAIRPASAARVSRVPSFQQRGFESADPLPADRGGRVEQDDPLQPGFQALIEEGAGSLP